MKAYVFRFVGNAAINTMRRNGRTTTLSTDHIIFDSSAGPRDVAEKNEFQERAGSDRGKRVHLANVTFSLRSVEKREPIPGLTLPVGRPILQTREYSAAIRVISGRDYGFVLNPGAGQGVLIVRLRAEPPPNSPDHETDTNE